MTLLEHVFPSFESESAARAEDAYRQDALDRHLKKMKAVRSRSLDHGLDDTKNLRKTLSVGLALGTPQKTLASSFWMREVRNTLLGSLYDAVRGMDSADLRVVGVLNRDWVLPSTDLHRFDSILIKGQLRTHLERAGVLTKSGFIVGFLDGEYDPYYDTFTLHYHLLTTRSQSNAMKDNLQPTWGYRGTASRASAIRRDKLKDPAKQLSYLLKAFWPSRSTYVDQDGRALRRRSKMRIPEPQHSQYLLWLHRQQLSSISVVAGCTIRNDRVHI